MYPDAYYKYYGIGMATDPLWEFSNKICGYKDIKMKQDRIAEYECVSCKTKFTASPGPTNCPRCNNVFVIWKNYREK